MGYEIEDKRYWIKDLCYWIYDKYTYIMWNVKLGKQEIGCWM